MARSNGGGGLKPGRGKNTRDIYEGLPSDANYKRTAHRRAAQQARKAWQVRLLVVAALAVAIYYFGDDVKRMVSAQVSRTSSDVQGVGNSIKEGRDRRSGANFEEGK